MTLSGDKLELARRAFPPNLVHRKPGGQNKPASDYVNHASVTDRLIAVDPDYQTVDFAEFEAPGPEGSWWVRGTLIVGGASRTEYGNGRDPKKAASDWIKRAAMRFGIGLDLWKKDEQEDFEASPPSSPPVQGERDGGGGDVGEGEGAAYGEGAATDPSPAHSSEAQATMEEYHPGRPHKMRDSENLPGARYCAGYGSVRCGYFVGPEEGRKG